MAKSKSASTNSKTFPIVVTVLIIAMVAVVTVTVISNKNDKKAQGKIEYSESPTVSAVSVNGNLGESTLPAYNSDTNPDPAVGKIVPQIVAQDFSGKDQVVTPGKDPYVLTFVAHWCPHCRKEVPIIVKLHDEGKLPKNVDFIAVATGTDPAKVNYPPSSWLYDEDWPWLKIADDKKQTVATAFGASGWPYLIFVNADGTVSQRMDGEQSEQTYIDAANKIAKTGK